MAYLKSNSFAIFDVAFDLVGFNLNRHFLYLQSTLLSTKIISCPCATSLQFVVINEFQFLLSIYLWNVDAILFQAELPKVLLDRRSALRPLEIVVFYPHSTINFLLFDQGSAISILSSYWIQELFVDRSVDTIFISGRGSSIWSRLHHSRSLWSRTV